MNSDKKRKSEVDDNEEANYRVTKAIKKAGKGLPAYIPKGEEAQERKAAYEKYNNEKEDLIDTWKALQSGETQDKGRNWTLAIAVPASALNNASTVEMKTYIAGQIARSAAVFCADEIVVYNDNSEESQIENPYREPKKDPKRNMLLLARILQYCECPQYLRSHFFPIHDDLKYVGLLNPLDAPHHLRENEFSEYREGVVVGDTLDGSVIDIGLRKRVIAKDQHAVQGNRVTFMSPPTNQNSEDNNKKKKDKRQIFGKLVDRHRPRTKAGLYWGYDVRVADTFSSVFTQSPFDDGYDLLIGIGPNGKPVEKTEIPKFRHALIVFSGVKSIEGILKEDEKLEVKNPCDLFDAYISAAPTFNTGHVRVEESMLMSLSLLRPRLQASGFQLLQSITIDENNVAHVPI